MTIDELAPHADQSVEFLVNGEVFYHEGDLTVPVRPNSGMDCARVLLYRDQSQTTTTVMTRRVRVTSP